MTRHRRVLLLEDDAQIRRFVALVLEAVDLELVECACVADAVRAFEQGPVDVAICDLMLVGESGFDLIEQVRQHAAWRATRVVVFSAAIDAADRERMAALGVWGELAKPTPISDLLRCVEDALAPMPARPAEAGATAAVPAAARLPSSADERLAVARFFEGDQALFEAYRDSCRAQFPADVVQGDLACASADWPAMRRLAHSLKTVLGSLGGADLASGFAALEASARLAEADAVRLQWQGLRSFLQQLAEPQA